jgi:hypothetical protein
MPEVTMRTLTIAMLVVLTLALTAHAEMSARDATALVKEYVAADTTDKRRESITAALAKEPPITAQKGLKDALKVDATRPLALDLAIALKCPGLFDSVKKLIDGEDEDKITKLGLLTGDKGAAEFLADRWAKVETDSASFGYLQAGFESTPIELKAIQKFKDALKGERKVEAGKIVAFQFGAAEAEPVTLLSEWPDLEAAFKLDAQVFDVKGTSVASLPTFKHTGRAIGANYRMPLNTDWSADLPDEWSTGSFKMTVRLRASYVGPDKGAKFTIKTEKGVIDFVHRSNEWFVPSGSGAEFTGAVDDGAWATFDFVFTDKSSDAVKYMREFSLEINGKEVIPRGEVNGRLKSLLFVSRASTCTFGGAELNR